MQIMICKLYLSPITLMWLGFLVVICDERQFLYTRLLKIITKLQANISRMAFYLKGT